MQHLVGLCMCKCKQTVWKRPLNENVNDSTQMQTCLDKNIKMYKSECNCTQPYNVITDEFITLHINTPNTLHRQKLEQQVTYTHALVKSAIYCKMYSMS